MHGHYYTLLICVGTHGKLRQIRMPSCVIHALLAFSVAGALTTMVLAQNYARMLLKVSQYNSLRAERKALKSQYRRLEGVAAQTLSAVESLESLADEMAIANGFADVRSARFNPNLLGSMARRQSTPELNYSASVDAFHLLMTKGAATDRRKAGREVLLNSPDGGVIPSIWPVRGEVSAYFGQRMDPFTGEPAFHAGIDIAAPIGAGVLAAADGIVLYSGRDRGYGNEVFIDHGFGFATRYGHLSARHVVIGQEVIRGQIIGAVGDTGRSTGPHLHYEVLIHLTPTDPAQYLRGTDKSELALNKQPRSFHGAARGR